MSINTKDIDAEEQEKIAIFSRFAGNGAARNIHMHTGRGIVITPQQVDRIMKNYERPVGTLESPVDLDSSNATKLMDHLKVMSTEGSLSYVALYHQVTSSSLVVADKASLRKDAAERVADLKEGNPMGPLTNDQISAQLALDSMDTDPALKLANLRLDVAKVNGNTKEEKKQQHKVDTIQDKLSIGASLDAVKGKLVVGQKILLAVAWCTSREQHMFDLYPEVLMFDCTASTNSEHRPLAVTCSPDGNMEVFTPVRAFLPSECKWVFKWMFETAIPELLGNDALGRTQLMLSDGDSNIYNSFDSVQKKLYPNAVHGSSYSPHKWMSSLAIFS